MRTWDIHGIEAAIMPQDESPHDQIETTLRELTREGALSDARYCEVWTNTRRRRGLGPLRILHELIEKGIAPEEASSVVVPDDPAWTEAAIRLRWHRFGQVVPGAWPDKVKQMKFLQVRGYSPEQIRSALTAR